MCILKTKENKQMGFFHAFFGGMMNETTGKYRLEDTSLVDKVKIEDVIFEDDNGYKLSVKLKNIDTQYHDIGLSGIIVNDSKGKQTLFGSFVIFSVKLMPQETSPWAYAKLNVQNTSGVQTFLSAIGMSNGNVKNITVVIQEIYFNK